MRFAASSAPPRSIGGIAWSLPIRKQFSSRAARAAAGVVRMSANVWIQLALYVGVLIALVKPLGWYMARVYQGRPCGLDRALGWLERAIYRLAGVRPRAEMGWKAYAIAVLLFNGVGL